MSSFVLGNGTKICPKLFYRPLRLWRRTRHGSHPSSCLFLSGSFLPLQLQVYRCETVSIGIYLFCFQIIPFSSTVVFVLPFLPEGRRVLGMDFFFRKFPICFLFGTFLRDAVARAMFVLIAFGLFHELRIFVATKSVLS